MALKKDSTHCLSDSPLAEGQRKFARVAGREIVLFKVQGEIYAIDDSCPHNGASLFSGRLDGFHLKCPAHGLSFDIRTGCMKTGAGFNVRTYQCQSIDDSVEIDFGDSPKMEQGSV